MRYLFLSVAAVFLLACHDTTAPASCDPATFTTDTTTWTVTRSVGDSLDSTKQMRGGWTYVPYGCESQ